MPEKMRGETKRRDLSENNKQHDLIDQSPISYYLGVSITTIALAIFIYLYLKEIGVFRR